MTYKRRFQKISFQIPLAIFICFIAMSVLSAHAQSGFDKPIVSYKLYTWYLDSPNPKCLGMPDKLVLLDNQANYGGSIVTFWFQFSDKTIVAMTYMIPGNYPVKPTFYCGVAFVDGASIKISDGPVYNWDAHNLAGKVSLPTKAYYLDLPIDKIESIGHWIEGEPKYDLSGLQPLLQSTALKIQLPDGVEAIGPK